MDVWQIGIIAGAGLWALRALAILMADERRRLVGQLQAQAEQQKRIEKARLKAEKEAAKKKAGGKAKTALK